MPNNPELSVDRLEELWELGQRSVPRHIKAWPGPVATTINGNISHGPPPRGPFAWDWAEVTGNPAPAGTAVTIWRGTAEDPREEIVLLLSGGYPDEIADWLEALAFIIRSADAR